jgi:hypothetical protein
MYSLSFRLVFPGQTLHVSDEENKLYKIDTIRRNRW